MIRLDRLYSVSQAARLLRLSERRVAQFCQAQRLGQRVGGRYIITGEELARFAKQPRKPGRPPSVSAVLG